MKLKYHLDNIEVSFFKRNIYTDIDDLQDEYDRNEKILNKLTVHYQILLMMYC
jgi:hypothetical protein